MKAKRRHELQENVLSSELAQVVGFFKKRGSAIAWGVLIAALIVFVIVYVRGKSQKKAARLQQDFDTAMTAATLTPEARKDILRSLAEQNDDERIAALSVVRLGDIYLAEMTVAGPTTDPVEWKRLGDEAGRWYRVAIDSFGDETLPVAKAHFGLGKLAENRRDFETARVEYQAAIRITELSGQDVVKRASWSMQRLELLGKPVAMATTAPAPKAEAQPATDLATQPTTAPATGPAVPSTTVPAAETAPAAPVAIPSIVIPAEAETKSSPPSTEPPATQPKD